MKTRVTLKRAVERYRETIEAVKKEAQKLKEQEKPPEGRGSGGEERGEGES